MRIRLRITHSTRNQCHREEKVHFLALQRVRNNDGDL
jgi:hypothetical protein